VNRCADNMFGIEVSGLNLKENIDQEVIDYLDKEINFFGVCIFKNQGSLKFEEQIKSLENFGSKQI